MENESSIPRRHSDTLTDRPMPSNESPPIPLHQCLSKSRRKKACHLISGGCGLSYRFSTGRTILITAAERGLSDVVRALIRRNVDLDEADNFHQTALHRACINGRVDTVQTLIGAGATINCVDSVGRTPLHWACAKGREGVVYVLIDSKASTGIYDRAGSLPADVAEAHNQGIILEYIVSYGNGEITQGQEFKPAVYNYKADAPSTDSLAETPRSRKTGHSPRKGRGNTQGGKTDKTALSPFAEMNKYLAMSDEEVRERIKVLQSQFAERSGRLVHAMREQGKTKNHMATSRLPPLHSPEWKDKVKAKEKEAEAVWEKEKEKEKNREQAKGKEVTEIRDPAMRVMTKSEKRGSMKKEEANPILRRAPVVKQMTANKALWATFLPAEPEQGGKSKSEKEMKTKHHTPRLPTLSRRNEALLSPRDTALWKFRQGWR
jgi:hypothetical protein